MEPSPPRPAIQTGKHLKTEHMAAPTKLANLKETLANPEPSTPGAKASDLGCPQSGPYREHKGHGAYNPFRSKIHPERTRRMTRSVARPPIATTPS
jgi:hypothetical protein